jgi:ATP-dependent Lhr-like helicase
VLDRLQQAEQRHFDGPEMQAVQPLLALQDAWSALPTGERGGGRPPEPRRPSPVLLSLRRPLVHTGLASLLAWRLASTRAATFSIAVNDYGFELLGRRKWRCIDWRRNRPGRSSAKTSCWKMSGQPERH